MEFMFINCSVFCEYLEPHAENAMQIFKAFVNYFKHEGQMFMTIKCVFMHVNLRKKGCYYICKHFLKNINIQPNEVRSRLGSIVVTKILNIKVFLQARAKILKSNNTSSMFRQRDLLVQLHQRCFLFNLVLCQQSRPLCVIKFMKPQILI